MNFALVPVFAWRNSFVLVSYLASFLVARLLFHGYKPTWLTLEISHLMFLPMNTKSEQARGIKVDSDAFYGARSVTVRHTCRGSVPIREINFSRRAPTSLNDHILVDNPPHERLAAGAGIEEQKVLSYSYKSRQAME